MRTFKLSSIFLATSVAAAVVLGGCSKEPVASTPQQKVYQVSTYHVQSQNVPVHLKLNGKITAFAKADVRPQVNGIITQRLFTEGQQVAAGQPLYQIDDIKYKAQTDLAKANLHKAEYAREEAYKKLQRYNELKRAKSVSMQDYDDVNLAYKSAVSDEQIAKANLINAQSDLDYTKVFAPIAGIVGKSTVTPGSLVTANQSEVLTTIIDLSKVYVDVQQSASSWRVLNQKIIDGRLSHVEDNEVQLIFDDGSIYPILGKLSLSEIQVDETSGSVTLRAIFDNPNNILLPGMAVRAELVGAIEKDVLVIPATSLLTLANGKTYVFLVNGDSTVTRKEVSVGSITAYGWTVTSGLEQGTEIVSSMVGTLKTGDKVTISNETDAVLKADKKADDLSSSSSSSSSNTATSPTPAATGLAHKSTADKTLESSHNSQTTQLSQVTQASQATQGSQNTTQALAQTQVQSEGM